MSKPETYKVVDKAYGSDNVVVYKDKDIGKYVFVSSLKPYEVKQVLTELLSRM